MDIVLKELFSTDIGLLSLFTILFIIGMGIWFSVWFKRKMDRDE
jgi:hypothetical protein